MSNLICTVCGPCTNITWFKVRKNNVNLLLHHYTWGNRLSYICFTDVWLKFNQNELLSNSLHPFLYLFFLRLKSWQIPGKQMEFTSDRMFVMFTFLIVMRAVCYLLYTQRKRLIIICLSILLLSFLLNFAVLDVTNGFILRVS